MIRNIQNIHFYVLKKTLQKININVLQIIHTLHHVVMNFILAIIVQFGLKLKILDVSIQIIKM